MPQKPKKKTQQKSKPKLKVKRSPISASVRYDVLLKAKFRCQCCGVSASQARLEIDHIKPVSKGGTNAAKNLQVLCMKCNRGKAAKHKTKR